jgi:predicted nucleic acid-binding protein
MGEAELLRARAQLEELWEAVDRVAVRTSLVRRAGDLADQHALRGYDAVHLASFETLASDETLLVTFDEDLRRAARAIGLTVAPAG